MRSVRNAIFLISMLLAVFVTASPAAAESRAPAIGCNSSGCSIWILAYSWPDVLEVNAIDFIQFEIDVNRRNVALSGSINYLGVLCRIPRISGSVVCLDNPESDEASTVAPAPGPWSPPALAEWSAPRFS